MTPAAPQPGPACVNIKHIVRTDDGCAIMCDTKEELLIATQLLIFGERLSDDHDEWQAILATLEDCGQVSFEGDPSIYWSVDEVLPYSEWASRLGQPSCKPCANA